MGKRTAAYYEDLISHGRVRVAERLDRIIGFVDAEPGELTRLFLLPSAAGTGLGHRLLVIGLEQARIGYKGPIRVEATLNAEGFYARHGFKTVCKGPASHQFSDDPIELAYMEMPQPEA